MAETMDIAEPKAMYTARDVTRLLTASYRHSRGSAVLQGGIFGFLALNYSKQITPELVSAVLPTFLDIAGGYIYKSGQHPPLGPESSFGSFSKDIEDDITSAVAAFNLCLEGNADPFDTRNTAEDVISADRGQIPYTRADSPWHYAMQPAKYRSNFVHHGILQRSTGLGEFDAFYARVIGDYWNLSAHRRITKGAKTQLQAVVAAHLSYNPADVNLLASAVAK